MANFAHNKLNFMSKSIIRVLVADDHDIVRQGIVAMLNREPDIEVVGTAVNGRDAVSMAYSSNPDIIVMDVSMPQLDGILAAGEIQALDLPAQVIMLSMHYDTVLVQQARKRGAVGYITKQQVNVELIPAIRAAFTGTASLQSGIS